MPPEDPEALRDSELRLIELFRVIDSDRDGIIHFQDFLDAQKPWQEALVSGRMSNLSASGDLLDEEIDALQAMQLAVHITPPKVARLSQLARGVYPQLTSDDAAPPP